MNLAELKWGCRLYSQLTTYDVSLRLFRRCVAPALDPMRSDHRGCLFTWLASWQCRQFAREHRSTTASNSLVHWASDWLVRMPSASVSLTELSPAEIRLCAAAYDALRGETASFKTRGGRSFPVTFGSTGAAKTLFALHPMVYLPWDIPIREHYDFSGDLESFRFYLTDVAAQLRSLATEAGVPVSALPALVGRPDSSPPKLIDEYNWVTITKGLGRRHRN